MRLKVQELGPCSRCQRPTFRERLPLVAVLETHTPSDPTEVEGAMRDAMAAQIQQMPMMIADALGMVQLVNLEQMPIIRGGKKHKGHFILCFRCLTGLSEWLNGLTAEEEAEYDAVDQTRRILRES